MNAQPIAAENSECGQSVTSPPDMEWNQRQSGRRNANGVVTVTPVDPQNNAIGSLSIAQCIDISESGICIALRTPINANFLRLEPSGKGLGFESVTVRIAWSRWVGQMLEIGGQFVTLPVNE